MDPLNREGRQKFVLLIRDRRNITRPRRAVLHADGSITYKKYLYYYSDKALTFYPTKPNLLGFTTGLLPAHYVRLDNSCPLILSKNGTTPIPKNGYPDIIPENPYGYEASDIAHKFKESNVVGGLATAARKSQQADMTQKYIFYCLAAILCVVILSAAVLINGMGILKLW